MNTQALRGKPAERLFNCLDNVNHWLCQWAKKAYSEGKSRQRKNSSIKLKSRFADQTNRIEEVFTMKKDKDISSLEHTSWRCQYHIVFAPKYRRMEIYGAIKQDIGIIYVGRSKSLDKVMNRFSIIAN